MERQTNKSFILSKIIIVPMHSSHTFSNCCHWCKFIQLETNIDWIMTLNHSFLACIIYTLWYFWKQTCFNSNKIKYFKANTNLLISIYSMHLTHTSSTEVAILVWIFLLLLYCKSDIWWPIKGRAKCTTAYPYTCTWWITAADVKLCNERTKVRST